MIAVAMRSVVETALPAILAAWFAWDYAKDGKSRGDAVFLSATAVVLGFAFGDVVFALFGGTP